MLELRERVERLDRDESVERVERLELLEKPERNWTWRQSVDRWLGSSRGLTGLSCLS